MVSVLKNFLFLLVGLLLPLAGSGQSFFNFESHQFRPVTMSPAGDRLFVTNTPDNRIEIFEVNDAGVVHRGSVMVGLEPVAVAARSDAEIWVVNHLSDSVSIVDVSGSAAYVRRTLHVGDEPRDIVFAGAGNRRAFITAAHRGQNSPYTDPENPGELTTPGIGRADVWVFDALNPGAAPGGNPVSIVTLFGDSPGPLAVSRDRSRVYAGVFKSGNQTTIVGRVLVCKGGVEAEPCELKPGGPVAPGGLPAPNANSAGEPMPGAGLIVKWDGKGWMDELGRDWSDVIRLGLPDYDVFELDALATPPRETAKFTAAGTILYALEVNPRTGLVYVANTEARNEVRFEGKRTPDRPYTTVQGHLHETRITLLDPATGAVEPRHLNPHIDYSEFPVALEVREKSLSMPVGMAFSRDGRTLYLAAKGSDKIAVLKSASIESGKIRPSQRDHIAVPGGGPAGLALDEERERLYVLSRFDNSLVVIDTGNRKILQSLPLYNPEPESVVVGRPLFFNAFLTSGNGESSCASCHVAGDKDELAWDLGDPYEPMLENPSRIIGPLPGDRRFHPMKGPMLTQTMRGIANHGPLHWRGDRTAGNDPDGDPLDTPGAMSKFNAAFVTLMGREEELDEDELQQLVDYSMSLLPPPNPIRALDNSLTPKQARGKRFFEQFPSVMGRATCASCHVLDPATGRYGSSGDLTFIIGGRPTKIPHHRNTYERVGMFGRAPTVTLDRDGEHMGPQVRGYGFTHDGGADTTIRFMSYPVFRFPDGDQQRREVEQYLFAYESNFMPIVGQQHTLDEANWRDGLGRAYLLARQAQAGNADLVARVVMDGVERGYLLLPDGTFAGDRSDEDPVELGELLEAAFVAGTTVTLTAVPPGTGGRIARDRDEDGVLDGDRVAQLGYVK